MAGEKGRERGGMGTPHLTRQEGGGGGVFLYNLQPSFLLGMNHGFLSEVGWRVPWADSLEGRATAHRKGQGKWPAPAGSSPLPQPLQLTLVLVAVHAQGHLP